MSPEKQQILFDKYPHIFQDRFLPPTKSGMAFGIDCPDGWFDLLDTTCAAIQELCDPNVYQVVATQVKEKWGSLRFYWRTDADGEISSWLNGVIDKIINIAEDESFRICADCGAPAEIQRRFGSVCAACKEKS